MIRNEQSHTKVVWDHCKDHKVLYTKGEKVNLGKYHQITFAPLRTSSTFSLRGLFFTIAALDHNLKGVCKPPPAKKQKLNVPAAAASSSSGSTVIEGKASVKQTGICGDQLHATTQNQLDKAAICFSDISNLHKLWLASSIMEHNARLHSEQAKSFRGIEDGMAFEMKMLKGGIHQYVRRSVGVLLAVGNYKRCGIDTSWGSTPDMNTDHVNIVYNDEQTTLMWTLLWNLVGQAEARNLVFTDGLPRKQSLLLDTDKKVVTDFIDEFRGDVANNDAMLEIDDEWATPIHRRSVFVKMSVQQLHLCLKADNWLLSQRLRSYLPCA